MKFQKRTLNLTQQNYEPGNHRKHGTFRASLFSRMDIMEGKERKRIQDKNKQIRKQ